MLRLALALAPASWGHLSLLLIPGGRAPVTPLKARVLSFMLLHQSWRLSPAPLSTCSSCHMSHLHGAPSQCQPSCSQGAAESSDCHLGVEQALSKGGHSLLEPKEYQSEGRLSGDARRAPFQHHFPRPRTVGTQQCQCQRKRKGVPRQWPCCRTQGI